MQDLIWVSNSLNSNSLYVVFYMCVFLCWNYCFIISDLSALWLIVLSSMLLCYAVVLSSRSYPYININFLSSSYYFSRGTLTMCSTIYIRRNFRTNDIVRIVKTNLLHTHLSHKSNCLVFYNITCCFTYSLRVIQSVPSREYKNIFDFTCFLYRVKHIFHS